MSLGPTKVLQAVNDLDSDVVVEYDPFRLVVAAGKRVNAGRTESELWRVRLTSSAECFARRGTKR